MSTSDDPKPPKRGRPKSNRVTTRIRLEKVVFDDWQTRKDCLGFGDKSHSEFAEYLLSNCVHSLNDSPAHSLPGMLYQINQNTS